MKRIASFILLSVFLYSAAGVFVVFKIQQHEIKQEIKSRIKNNVPESELVILSFDPSSKEHEALIWLEDHEFLYRGEMYDIVRQFTDEKNIVHYYCINDEQESKLFANLDESVDKNMQDNNKSNDVSKTVLKLYSQTYFSLLSIHASCFKKNDFRKSNFSNCYKSPLLEIISPPPRIV